MDGILNEDGAFQQKNAVFYKEMRHNSAEIKENDVKSLLLDIWNSYRSLPTWVQIWVAFILVPVNLMSILFWQEPNGALIAVLAIGGMAPNVILMVVERGFSKAMAISHLVLWVPLLFVIVPKMGIGSSFAMYLALLFWIDAISICFDIKDSWQWLNGDREVPGH
jgi:hypothetical protein